MKQRLVESFIPILLYLQSIEGKLSIGLDLEWEVPKTRNVQRKRVSVIQLAFRKPEEVVLVISLDLRKTDLPRPLQDLLKSEKAVFVGRGVKGDVEKLKTDWNIDINANINTLSLEHLCHRKGFVPNAKKSLQALTEVMLGFTLEKRDDIRLSRWNNAGLTTDQRSYAARDAWASLLVYEAAMNGVVANPSYDLSVINWIFLVIFKP
ncbi:hypothetical protein HDU67_009851 [Dinochytrium kinnereticum]|nr:hypothetical protein HDU67_009851 [Dinochytrium kinnereticum]